MFQVHALLQKLMHKDFILLLLSEPIGKKSIFKSTLAIILQIIINKQVHLEKQTKKKPIAYEIDSRFAILHIKINPTIKTNMLHYIKVWLCLSDVIT